jgi:hypothetical protein
MNLKLDIQSDSELRAEVKNVILGQVKSIIKDDISQMVKNEIGQMQGGLRSRLDVYIESEVKKIIERNVFGNSFGMGTPTSAINTELASQLKQKVQSVFTKNVEDKIVNDVAVAIEKRIKNDDVYLSLIKMNKQKK